MLSAEMRADIWQKERTEQRKKDARHLHIAEGNCLKRRKTKGISLHSDHDVVFQRRNKHSCCTFSNLKRASPGGPIRVESIKYETNRRGDSQASTQWDTVARSMCYIYILCISCVLCKCGEQYFTPAFADSPTDVCCNPFACHANSPNQETVAMSQSKQLSELKLSMQLHMSSYYSQHLSVCTHSVSVDLLTSCPWMAAICNRQRLQQQRTKFGMCRAEQFGLDTQRRRRRDKAVANWAESGSEGKWKMQQLCQEVCCNFQHYLRA